MTVMIGRFFGLPQHLIRNGIWKQMKPGEKDLYVCLLHRSEWHMTRTVTLSDATIEEEVGAAPRTCCNARKKLQERGLIKYRLTNGGAYIYEICDPATGLPYPGQTNVPVIPPKEGKNKSDGQKTEARNAACQTYGNRPSPKSTEKRPLVSPPWNEIGKKWRR